MGFGVFLRQENHISKKKLGYYEIEHIDDPCILTLVVNPRVSQNI